MNKLWRGSLAGLFGALALVGEGALAQSYPARPITFIYPYAAGSTTDAILRAMAVDAGKTLGQPIITEYRTGASGKLGIQAQQRAPGDGHMLSMIASNTVITIPLTDSSFRIEPGKDYSPIIATYFAPYVVAVNPAIGVKDMKGLLAYIKANQTKFNAGTIGLGNDQQIGAVFIGDVAGAEVTAISYKGEGEMLPALLGNQVQMALISPSAKPHFDAGRIFGIAVTSPQRLTMYPEFPTGPEAGVPALTNMGFWVGIVAPPQTSRDPIVKVNAAYGAALKNPDIAKRITDGGQVILGGTPEDVTNRIREGLEKLRPIIQRLGVKVQ